MSALRTTRLRWLLLVGLALVVGGCGDEHHPSHAEGGPPAAPLEDLAFKDPGDTELTGLDLTASAEYVPPTADLPLGQVNIYARILDDAGNLLENLNSFNFNVILDPKGAPKTVPQGDVDVVLTESSDHVVALVIDSSGSMTGLIDSTTPRMRVARDAAKLFVSLMKGTDRTAVVDFDDNATVTQQLTADAGDLNRAIDALEAAGATNLGAAMTEAVRAVGARPGKRAAILLTDGDDTVDPVSGGPEVWLNDSSSTRLQGLELLRKSAMVVYTVGLGADLSETGLADLQVIAEATGGQFFQALTASDLLDAFGTIIPAQIEALAPVQTYLLTFPNTVAPIRGTAVTVPMVMSVAYENAVALHRAEFGTSYTVE